MCSNGVPTWIVGPWAARASHAGPLAAGLPGRSNAQRSAAGRAFYRIEVSLP